VSGGNPKPGWVETYLPPSAGTNRRRYEFRTRSQRGGRLGGRLHEQCGVRLRRRRLNLKRTKTGPTRGDQKFIGGVCADSNKERKKEERGDHRNLTRGGRQQGDTSSTGFHVQKSKTRSSRKKGRRKVKADTAAGAEPRRLSNQSFGGTDGH